MRYLSLILYLREGTRLFWKGKLSSYNQRNTVTPDSSFIVIVISIRGTINNCVDILSASRDSGIKPAIIILNRIINH